MEDKSIVELFGSQLSNVELNNPYKKLDLQFNPFPRSGIADLNSSTEIVTKLSPIDTDIKGKIAQYIFDSLFPSSPSSQDKYLSMIVRGDYGYGKTQTLLYSKCLLEYFQSHKKYNKNPYVVYIDNPGVRLTELIGSIISQIGEENFKRYLWTIILEEIKSSEDIKEKIKKVYQSKASSMFVEEYIDPFNVKFLVSYKLFFDNLYKFFLNDPKKRKELQEVLKDIIINILIVKLENPIIATFFYELLLENIGVNKVWDAITTGQLKELDKKEVYLIRAIVKLLNQQGYTDFYILIDEFEAITASGRLSSSEIERYISNLRALIDRERNWCSVFAMTGLAYTKLKSISPPLADRIGGRTIDLKPLNDSTAEQLTINYLDLARNESAGIKPFTHKAIVKLTALSNGILRLYLKSCYSLLQRAVNNDQMSIDEKFVERYFEGQDEE